MKNMGDGAQGRAFRILVFDWDGTAVKNRTADARPVARALEELLKLEVYVVVVTGTNFDNVDRQFACHINGPHKRNLYICTNRGSEVYGFDARSELFLLYLREASEEENDALDKTAEAVKAEVEGSSGATINIVYKRLNRRKIDLIPEWVDPPKSQIGKLLKTTEKRLRTAGYTPGIKGAYEATGRYARELGLTDARITSDVKHVEVGLTDKSDSIRWVLQEVAVRRNIPYRDIMVAGDEFGPIAGFEGSDFRMVLPEAAGITYVSVGKEPNGVPEGVEHLGGGPAMFLHIVKEQAELHRRFLPTSDPTFLVVEEGYNPEREREVESIFTVGNGYLGTRGSLAEQDEASSPATLVAGVFDRRSQRSPEELLVFPDWLYTRIYVDDERLQMKRKNIVEHRRVLDMSKGLLFRELLYEDITDRIVLVRFLHFASLADPHALAMRVTVVPRNFRGELRVETGLRLNARAVPPLQGVEKTTGRDGGGVLIRARTLFTLTDAAVAQRSRVAPGFVEPEYSYSLDEMSVLERWRWIGTIAQEVTVEKFVSIYTNLDGVEADQAARAHVDELAGRDLEELLLEHAAVWEERWDGAAVRISGDPEAQRWSNFAAYHLISAGNADNERLSIGARALSGPIYKGHIFWDSELFILPFFIFTHPPTARAMVMYRYNTLNGARTNAARNGYKGAQFAWESTGDGEEMTPPAALSPAGEVIPILSGLLEHHISAAVAYGAWTYWNATHDERFLREAGAEIIMETARFWASRVEQGDDGLYHIRGVEGPDEYHEDVDDNLYTNLMAVYNLRHAVKVEILLRESWPDEWQRLRDKLGLESGEPERWSEVADRMCRDGGREDGVLEQFAGFFSLEDIDIRRYEPRTAALDTILGRERVMASQVVKQADVVMALYLLEDQYTQEAIRDNFVYYDRRTAHGSSLSPAVYGLVAARLGMTREALEYLRRAGTIDLSDNMGNAAGGVHAASLGALWQQLVMGFAGVRAWEAGLFIDPKLPARWPRLEFPVSWRGTRLDFDIRRNRRIGLKVSGEEGREVDVGIFGRPPRLVRTGAFYASAWSGGTWQDFEEVTGAPEVGEVTEVAVVKEEGER
jgi:trehalose/maltose hydrolase-like predicted phosphorylase/hydroxymethylpyrimidine pyrophosphatase-like HAD family hydrolase